MFQIILLIFSVFISYSHAVVLLRSVKYNTQCLTVQGASTQNNAGYQLADCDSNSPFQWMDGENWEGYSSSPGQLRHVFSNKCPSVTAWGADDGVVILQYDCSNQGNQQWKITNGDYLNTFQLQSSSSKKCLTAEGAGSYLDQWACYDINGSPHQYWKIDFIEPTPKKTILQNYKYTDKCLHVKGGSFDNSAELELVDCDTTNSQLWLDISDWDDMYGTIKFTLSKKCITVVGAGTGDGVRVDQYDCSSPNPDNQIWVTYTDNGGADEGLFQLVSQVSGRCLTAENPYLDQWECFSPTNAPHQYWKPVAVTLTGGSGAQQDAPTLTLTPTFPVYAALENGGDTAGLCIYSATSQASSLSLKSCDSAIANNRVFEVSHLTGRNDLKEKEYLQSFSSRICLSLQIILTKNSNGIFGEPTPMLKACVRPVWRVVPSYQDPTYFQIQLANTNQNLNNRVCLIPDTSNTKLTTLICNSAKTSHYWKLRYANADNTCGSANQKKCSGEYEGMCCSSDGKCGLGSSFCGSGCQDGYGGSCTRLSDLMTKVSNAPNGDRPVFWDRECGAVYKKRCTGASKRKCCGSKSQCVQNQHDCLEAVSNGGCQRVWGLCMSQSDQYKNIWLRFG